MSLGRDLLAGAGLRAGISTTVNQSYDEKQMALSFAVLKKYPINGICATTLSALPSVPDPKRLETNTSVMLFHVM
jgi:hypothetical protein